MKAKELPFADYESASGFQAIVVTGPMRHPGAGCEAIENYQKFLRAKIHVNRHLIQAGY
jgi:hypothetical protein